MARDTITIMQIIPALEIGGAELLLLSICKGLSKKDEKFKFIIIVLYENLSIQYRFKDAGFEIISLNLINKRFYQKIFAIYRLIKKIKPDIIHTHLIPADRYGLIAAFIAGMKNRISTAHSQRIDTLFSDIITPFLFHFSASRIIAVSHVVKSNYINKYKIPSDKIFVIYSAPSFTITENVAPKKHPGKNASFRIVLVANCKPAKGQLVLIKAIKEITYLNPSISLDIYGDYSSDEYGKLCVNEINNSTIKLPIFLKGRIENVQDILGNYDLMISASFWEGFPLSIVEGMMIGLPIIATDIEPHREILGTIDNFPFVKAGSHIELSNMIKKVISDPDYFYYLSKMNLQRANDFTQEKMIDNYYKFYENLIK